MISRGKQQDDGGRPGVFVAVTLLLAGCAVVLLLAWKRNATREEARLSNPEAAQETVQPAIAVTQPEEAVPVLVNNDLARPTPAAGAQSALKRLAVTSSISAPPAAPRPDPSPMARFLVNNVVGLETAGVPKTPEQVAAWKQQLKNLVQQGEAALPAIQEYLERNVDFALGAEGTQALGYSSTRAALYDALTQIGGAGAAGVLLSTLQSSGDPRDMVGLARSLEQIAPEQYRQQILDASREVLASVSGANGGNQSQTDVALLFQMLGEYGGASAAAEIQNAAGAYKYYSAIALAQLPDGAGVPSLIQMVQDNGGGQVKSVAALQALTQSAGQSADARAALVQLTRANTISPYGWANLTATLGGDQTQFLDSASGSAPAGNNNDVRTYHIASGNQNFYTAPPPGGMTPDQITQQMALIDELLSATSNPSALQALQSAKSTLVKRSQTAALK